MPAPRGSVRLCEAVEGLGARLHSLLSTVESVMSDGLVTPDESALLRDQIAATEQAYEPIPGRASQQDGVFRVIGAIAQAGQITPWIDRITREGMEDEERLFGIAA